MIWGVDAQRTKVRILKVIDEIVLVKHDYPIMIGSTEKKAKDIDDTVFEKKFVSYIWSCLTWWFYFV